jgi:thioredoxin reductase
MLYDVVIAGGGPAGLSAALTLGRARKRVLLCDGGARRNAATEHIQNFITRDGVTPTEFRRVGRQQLQPYEAVEVRDVGVERIGGSRGAFEVRLESGDVVTARRILLSTGMIDELPEIEGFTALWGRSIFICPYCHAWEVQDRRFGFLAPRPDLLEFSVMLRGWARDVVVLTDGRFAVPPEVRTVLTAARVSIEERRITRLAAREGQLHHLEFVEGGALPLDVLFVRPPQRQVPVVQSLGLAVDPMGYLTVDEMGRETSVPGIHAGGDLVTAVQGAVLAAASGMRAAAALNHALTADMAANGMLP